MSLNRKYDCPFGTSHHSSLDISPRPTTRRLAIMNLALRGIEADFVLANGSMSSKQSGEGDIRRALIETDLVDCRAPSTPPLLHRHGFKPSPAWGHGVNAEGWIARASGAFSSTAKSAGWIGLANPSSSFKRKTSVQ